MWNGCEINMTTKSIWIKHFLFNICRSYENVVLNLVGQKPQYNTNIEIFFLYSAGQKPQIRTNIEMSSYIQQDKRQNKQIGDVVLYP